MNLSALCKCCTFASLVIAVTGEDFANVNLSNDASTDLGYVLHERLHAEIGVASPLFRNPGNDDLVAIVEQKIHSVPSRRQLSTCKLQTTCFNRSFIHCNFKGCQSETTLSLQDKQLTGPLPTNLSQLLPELSELDLSSNQLSGSIDALGNLAKLKELNLTYNKLSGATNAFSKLTKLNVLLFGRNSFTGEITDFSALTQLTRLYMERNSLSGHISGLKKLVQLRELSIYKNKFEGDIDDLSALISLRLLTISHNKFSGKIDALVNLEKLQYLDISMNNFEGVVDVLSNFTKLLLLGINHNNFTGSLTQLGKLILLKTLHINNNQFEDTIEAIESLTNLEKLYMESNQLYGDIGPVEKLTKLTRLQLSNNNFTGSIQAVGSLSKLQYLDLNSNNFTGNPQVLSKLNQLEHLYLNANNFTGNIDFLKDMLTLSHISLAFNGFSGDLSALDRASGVDKLETLSLANMSREVGDIEPPIPLSVFQKSTNDIAGLELACEVQVGDQSPFGNGSRRIFGIGENAILHCRGAYTLLSNGSWVPKEITSGKCADSDLAVISTLAECEEAAFKMQGTNQVEESSEHLLPYCSQIDGIFYFDATGMNEGEGIHVCSTDRICVCKQATAEAEVQCTYNKDTKRAEWTPDISNHVCLGKNACKIDDTTAGIMRSMFNVDVSHCSTLQDGSSCTDFKCTTYESHVRNPNVSADCAFERWKTEYSEYCMFCEAGRHKVTDTRCEECDDGKWLTSSTENDSTECANCTTGTKRNSTDIGCQECAAGWYQDTEGQSSCLRCPAGKFVNTESQSACNDCPAGQFQIDVNATECKTCSNVMYSCPEGSVEPTLLPGMVVLVVVIVLAVPIIIWIVVKFIHLHIRVSSIWQPQSEADALSAKEFVLPKASEEMTPSVEVLKDCLEHFVDKKGWSTEQKATILEHRNIVVTYLGQRVEEAADPKAQHIMRCCLNMDALHDFKTLYDATMMNIRNKERDGLKAYTVTVSKLQAKCSVCPPNASDLMELYETGRVAYPLFHAFIAKAASASGTAYSFKSNGKQPGMKGLYRVLEKAVFKYNDDIKNLNFGAIRDLVRGGIIDTKMDGLAKVAEYILNSTEVTVCRIKDRFNEPSSAGWTDLLINFYLNNDPGKHVCEVQLIHFKMLSQRTTQEGHGAYNIYRAAAELMNKFESNGFSLVKKTRPKSPNHARVAPANTSSPSNPQYEDVIPMRTCDQL